MRHEAMNMILPTDLPPFWAGESAAEVLRIDYSRGLETAVVSEEVSAESERPYQGPQF